MSVKMTAQVDITFDGAFDNCHIANATASAFHAKVSALLESAGD